MELCVDENSMAFEVITFQKEALNRLSLDAKRNLQKRQVENSAFLRRSTKYLEQCSHVAWQSWKQG